VVSGFCRDLSVFPVWTVLLLLLSIRGEGRSRLFGSFSNVFGKSDIFWTFLRRSSLSLSISALTIRSVRYLSHTHSLHPSTPVSLSFHPHIPQPPMEGLEVWGRRDGALTDMVKTALKTPPRTHTTWRICGIQNGEGKQGGERKVPEMVPSARLNPNGVWGGGFEYRKVWNTYSVCSCTNISISPSPACEDPSFYLYPSGIPQREWV